MIYVDLHMTKNSNLIFLYDDKYGTTYRFKEKIPVKDREGFYLIPNFENYAINSSGVVINISKGNVLKSKVQHLNTDRNTKYLTYTLFSKGKAKVLRVHRLLMLVFSEYDFHPATMTVNHLDGDSMNNDLTNLEWATQKRNVEHAFSTGLMDGVLIKIDCLNYITNVEFSCLSAVTASKMTKLKETTIRGRLSSYNGVKHKDGWRFKYADEPWEELDKVIQARKSNREVYVLDIRDNSVSIFDTVTQAAQELEIDKSVIINSYTKQNLTPYMGYMFRLSSDQFPTFTEHQLNWFKKLDYPKQIRVRGVLLKYPNGIYEMYHPSELLDKLGYKNEDSLMTTLRSKGELRGIAAETIEPYGIKSGNNKQRGQVITINRKGTFNGIV